jgi:hypothetical protein
VRAERTPNILGDVGLQVRRLACCGLLAQAQVKRHLVRRFAGAYNPAGKYIVALRSRLKCNLVRAKANMSEQFWNWRRRFKLTVPHINCDSMLRNLPC